MSKKETVLDTQDDILDPMDVYVTLDLDDGSTVECSILSIFDVQDQDYIALLPLDEEGNPSLENILDDEEYEIVADRFDEIQDEQEFEEM